MKKRVFSNTIAILSKQFISTTMELHYNCTHNVMLTSLIVIHLLKSKHVAKDICNSLYLYIVNVNGQIT